MPEQTEQHAPAPVKPVENPYAVLRWLVLATFVVILNETLMVNAIPRLIVDLDITARAAQWVSTAFMLTMAVVIPVTGWFLQRVTTRVAFRTAMLTFLAGSVIAGVAPVFPLLLAGRIVQAAGTAVMLPLLMTTLMTIVPEHDRGRVMGNVTLAISVAPALGPAVSGVVLQFGSWRLLFAVMVPIAGAVTWLALRHLVDVGEPAPSSIDVFSVVLAALGFGSLVYGLSLIGGPQGSARPTAFIVGGLAVVGLFVWRQVSLQRKDAPLLDLRVLAHRTYTVGITIQSVGFLAMMGAMILLPLYLQEMRGLSPLQTGLLVAPGGLAMGLLGPRVGAAFDKVGARPLVIPASVGIVAGLALLSRIGETTPYVLVVAVHMLLMASLAALFTPVFTISLGALPGHLYSHGSSLLGTTQQVAGAVGTAVSITVLSSRASSLLADGASPAAASVGGFRWAFAVAAVVAVLVVGLVLLLPARVADVDPDADPDADPSNEVEPAPAR
ncbi:MDR family MFS transporter [Nocardioides acrostichi]|uniref:Multidrug efflux MFS transporter n=1 Tax=Nocardioides acrostichi TaxID=2784339 RepID=A0A930Y5J8_9ACTN|nr:MDR family MFS transporter [Nocardioides acrostichi]MBF4161315.1 multidrug efflux MFS transporter [Nocardioides acrostichi]